MDMLPLVLSLLLPLLLTFVVVSVLWRCQRGWLCHFAIKATLSLSVGFGLAALVSIVSLLTFHTLHYGLVLYILSLLVLIFLIRFVKPHSTVSLCQSLQTPQEKQTILMKIFRYSFLFVFLAALCVLILFSLANPNGQWDGWAIWNEHAKVVALSGSSWTRVFAQVKTHPDYPLLLPLLIARLWIASGTINPLAPIVVSILFTLGTICLLVVAVSQLKGSLQGLLAGFVLLSTPSFLYFGSAQYADIPVGFFYLSTLVCLTLALQLKRYPSLFLLAGFSLSCALFTKNEGYQFLVAVLLALVITYRPSWYIQEGSYFIVGLLPILGINVLLKKLFPVPNDIFANQTIQTLLQKMTDVSRYFTVASFFISRVFRFGGFFLNIPGILFFYTLFVGIKKEASLTKPLFVCIWTLALTLLGFFFIYIITPHDLHWHLNSSLDRLFLQLWPSALYTLFLALPSPEQVLQTGKDGGTNSRKQLRVTRK